MTYAFAKYGRAELSGFAFPWLCFHLRSDLLAMSLKRSIKNFGKQLLGKGFRVGQSLGIDVLPRHFYSEIPDFRRLRSTSAWRQPYSLIACRGCEETDKQLQFIRELLTPEVCRTIESVNILDQACRLNQATGYGAIEADCLYAFIVTKQPARITQIGCGISTAICLQAADDAGYTPTINCIEPFPNEFLSAQHVAGQIRLTAKPVEDLSLDFLDDLSAGDFFFIDSSHTLGPAGEVTRIVCEMLPRLASGVYAHFHDIWFPYDFAPKIFQSSLFFWHETALLMAFLSGNDSFETCASLSQLVHARRAEVQDLFSRYSLMEFDGGVERAPGEYPSSIYLKRH